MRIINEKSMTKYIYDNNNLRCRLKRTGHKNQIELQLQRKAWRFFWVNCFRWMTIAEGFWGECEAHPMLSGSYQFGNRYEVYMTGTLNIKKRVLEFFKEYYHSILLEKKRAKEFESIT